MQQIILIIHVLLCVSLLVLVLIQQGKGAAIGAAFGSGASQTVFGSSGAGSFLMKITALIAALFFTTSLTLTYLTSIQYKQAQTQQQIQIPGGTPTPVQIPAGTKP